MAMPCCGISKKVTTSLPSSPADADDTVPAASSAAMLSTVTDKKLLFARPPVPGAAWVKENWLLGSQGTPKTGRSRARMSTWRFCAFPARLGGRGGFINGAGEGDRTLVTVVLRSGEK